MHTPESPLAESHSFLASGRRLSYHPRQPSAFRPGLRIIDFLPGRVMDRAEQSLGLKSMLVSVIRRKTPFTDLILSLYKSVPGEASGRSGSRLQLMGARAQGTPVL